MKNIFFYFLFLNIIKDSIQIIPFWNFQSSAIDLLGKNNYYEYIKYESNLFNVPMKLKRTIFKENGEIKMNNSLFIEEEYYGETVFDDIESHFQDSKKNYIICPKGKYHIYLCNKINKKCTILIPNDFPNIDNWNLMCYYQYLPKALFISYLGNQVNFYQYNLDEESFKYGSIIHEGIHTFRWDSNPYDRPTRFQMFAILKYGNKFVLDDIIFDVKKENYNYEIIKTKYLTELKSNYIATFEKGSYNFYWCNYNNIADFEIGAYSDYQEITSENFDIINIKKNINSPFEFFEKVTIEELKFIFGKSYAYYKLKYDKGKYYYGILDTALNKIIFNTNEELLRFIPYEDNAMLAITKDSAYKICAYRYENDCVYCGNQNIILDSSNYNFCGTSCNTKYILMPNNICTNSCDESIFIIKNNYECGLCKDLDGENKYKFINQSECIKEKPDNSIYVNEELKIIDCDKNYKYEKGKCIAKCHVNCDKCSMYSNDNIDQKCISCKNGLFLQEGNCLKTCSNNYFLNDRTCEKCDNTCKTCYQTSYNCTSCIKGKYIDIISETHECKDCSDNCESCEISRDNCISCNQASSFKFFFNYSCYENCPENTKINKINFTCEEIKNDDKNSKKTPVTLIAFSIIAGFLIFLILFFYIRRYINENKKSSEFFINEIDKELREK